MDHGEAVGNAPRNDMKAEAGNHLEDGQHRRVRQFAEDDRRPHDGNGHLGGQLAPACSPASLLRP